MAAGGAQAEWKKGVQEGASEEEDRAKASDTGSCSIFGASRSILTKPNASLRGALLRVSPWLRLGDGAALADLGALAWGAASANRGGQAPARAFWHQQVRAAPLPALMSPSAGPSAASVRGSGAAWPPCWAAAVRTPRSRAWTFPTSRGRLPIRRSSWRQRACQALCPLTVREHGQPCLDGGSGCGRSLRWCGLHCRWARRRSGRP